MRPDQFFSKFDKNQALNIDVSPALHEISKKNALIIYVFEVIFVLVVFVCVGTTFSSFTLLMVMS